MKYTQKFIFNIKKFQSISQIVVEIDQWIMPLSDTSNNNWMSHCGTTKISDETKGVQQEMWQFRIQSPVYLLNSYR